MTTMTHRRVRSGSVTLAVYEHSAAAPDKPSVILVHGYPDQADMWDLVIAELDLDEFHVVTYDVRGAGASDVPEALDGYRTACLVDDLVAVVDATVPEGQQVHLVGHDWGSVQLWDAVAAERHDERLAGRIGSFTSISGPSLDQMARMSRSPGGRRLRLLNQSVRSWYVYAFQVPVVPELAWTGLGTVAGRLGLKHWRDGMSANARNGVNLYRANVIGRMRSPQTLHVDVPVQVLHPTRDRFVTDVFLDDLEDVCSCLSIVPLDAGHWAPRSHAAEVAEFVAAHARDPHAHHPDTQH